MRPLGLVLFQYDWNPYTKEEVGHRGSYAQRKNDVETQGECHVKVEGGSDAPTSRGIVRITSKAPEARRGAWARFSRTALRAVYFIVNN